MAKAIKLPKNKEFNFKAAGGATSKYPWNEWLNGDLLMLERSTVEADGTVTTAKDYDVETDAMPAKVKTAARRRYKVVQISRVDADGNKLGDALIIRARDMTADEKTAEDIKRAEEKAARAEKDDEGDTAPTNEAPATTEPATA